MAVLITGGYGLIGSTLARMLVAKGEKVWVFDKFTPPQRFQGIADAIQTIPGDLANPSKVMEAVKESAPQVIFHLGGMLSLPANADPQSAYATNVAGTYHVLEAARLFQVPKVIFTSTIATYGLDIQKDVIDDFTLQRPITMYGATKVFGELLGRFYRTKYNIDFRAVRFPAIIGPGAKTAHISIYNAWAVEKAFYNEPYEIFVEPQIRCPILYFKDAARSLMLAERGAAGSHPDDLLSDCRDQTHDLGVRIGGGDSETFPEGRPDVQTRSPGHGFSRKEPGPQVRRRGCGKGVGLEAGVFAGQDDRRFLRRTAEESGKISVRVP